MQITRLECLAITEHIRRVEQLSAADAAGFHRPIIHLQRVALENVETKSGLVRYRSFYRVSAFGAEPVVRVSGWRIRVPTRTKMLLSFGV